MTQTTTVKVNETGLNDLIKPAKPTKYRAMTFDSLRVHCSKLDLTSKVTLIKELKEQVSVEVARAQESAAQAGELTKGI